MLQDYPKAIVTKDGTSILLRPAVPSDEDALKLFFSQIPPDEKWFLRKKLSDPELLRKWLESMDYDRVVPIIALREDDGTIIANLRLYRPSSKSIRHIGYMRIMVLPDYRLLKVGSWLILDAVKLAMDLGIEKLVAEFIVGLEEPAINAARKFDFQCEAVLQDYVKEKSGKYRDLLIMVKNLNKDWSDF